MSCISPLLPIFVAPILPYCIFASLQQLAFTSCLLWAIHFLYSSQSTILKTSIESCFCPFKIHQQLPATQHHQASHHNLQNSPWPGSMSVSTVSFYTPSPSDTSNFLNCTHHCLNLGYISCVSVSVNNKLVSVFSINLLHGGWRVPISLCVNQYIYIGNSLATFVFFSQGGMNALLQTLDVLCEGQELPANYRHAKCTHGDLGKSEKGHGGIQPLVTMWLICWSSLEPMRTVCGTSFGRS